MKCINRIFLPFILCFAMIISLSGCGRVSYELDYKAASDISSFNIISRQSKETAGTFAKELCVVTDNVTSNNELSTSITSAAILFRLSDCDVLFSQNAHEVLNPASLTKVMTALVALKYGSLDQVLTAGKSVNITESGAQLCGIKPGDTMTLDQALRILLIYSANDVAMMIAESIGGTVEHFVELMNEEANYLGATNSNFANPHGLTDPNHYTTAYDLYLIFKEAVKYESFNEIIQMTSYQTVYYNKSGNEVTFDKQTTNLFLRGDYSAPSNVTIIGGKTGTTAAAGHCLMLYARDNSGAPYIAIVMGEASTEELYDNMTRLLREIH